VNGLPDRGFYDLDLHQLFSKNGYRIKAATVASDPKTNRQSLGYGIVSFYDEAELERCLDAMNNSKVQSNTISLTR